MFCENCGAKLEEGAAFCTECGTPVEAGSPSKDGAITPDSPKEDVQQEAKKEEASNNVASNKATNTPKMPDNINKKMIGIIAAVAAVIMLLVVILISQPKRINLEDFVTVNYSGYNDYGQARPVLDRNGVEDAINERKGNKEIDSGDAKEYAKALQDYILIDGLISKISLDIDKGEGLSNGDDIKVEIKYDNELAKEHKIKFTGKSLSVTVEGLAEVLEVDPFDGLEVTFSGIAPAGQLELNYNGSSPHVNVYQFEVDNRYSLKNGDKVTVSMNIADENTLRDGYVFTVKEQDYEVEGLEEYIENYADISSEAIDKLKGEVEDTIYAYSASSYNSQVSLTNLEYAGYVYSTAKENAEYYNHYNYLYLMYTGTVSHSEGNFTPQKVYFPVKINDILKNGNEITYNDISGISGNVNLGGYRYSTKGYINPLIAYMDVVEANRDTYVSEAGDGFEKFEERKSVSKIADISETYRTELATDAKDLVESYIASDYSEGVSVADLELMGEYLLVAKNEGTDYEKNNRYIVVYSGTVSNSRGNFESTQVYYPVVYNGIVSLPDDQYMITSREGITGYSTFPDSWYSTNGYVDGTSMYNSLITANRDVYTYEVSEGLKEFGE